MFGLGGALDDVIDVLERTRQWIQNFYHIQRSGVHCSQCIDYRKSLSYYILLVINNVLFYSKRTGKTHFI